MSGQRTREQETGDRRQRAASHEPRASQNQGAEGSGTQRVPGVQGSGTGLPLVFVDVPAEYRDNAAVVVRLPPGVRSKRKLLAILAGKLRFPGYFGGNWDALEECLADLSWLPAGQRVAIVHEDLPFGAGGENRGIYLNILAAACGTGLSEHPLTVVFPTSLTADVAAAVSQESASST